MSARSFVLALFLLGIVVGTAPTGRAATAAGDAAKGKRIVLAGTSFGVAACVACHGEDGAGQADAGIPRLAGLDAAYIVAQLTAFGNGGRTDAVMTPIATAMDAATMADAAAYLAGLPPPASRPSDQPAGDIEAGAALARDGDWGKAIPPCASCHGGNGLGVGVAFPPIAGQPAIYIANQLRAWKAGTRHDDPLGLMRTVAARLDDKAIAGVAAYYQTLPARPAKAAAMNGPDIKAVSVRAGDRNSVAQPIREPTPRKTVFTPPPESAIPNNDFGRTVRAGEAIFRNTSAHAGAFVGNALSCSNCHLDAGRLANSAPLAQAYVRYPTYRAKNGRVNTFADRLRDCFRFSMNGKSPPLGSDVLVALETYSYFLATGAPTGEDLAGRGYPKLPKPAMGMDYARGAAVFGAKCAICHGADGAGQAGAGGATVFPSLWGPGSFNWGAGMGSIANAAGFIKANMPLGQGGSLSDQEAWDVATYMDSHERPQDPRFVTDVATTRRKFHDSAMSMYGRAVSGVVLGAKALAARPRGDEAASDRGTRP